MKPDGATMETREPGDTAALAEHSSQENITEEAQPQPEAVPAATQKANGRPVTVNPKVKSKAGGSKIQSTSSTGVGGSNSRPGTASHRTEKDVKSSSAGPVGKKTAGATSKTSAAGVAPKRPVGVTAVSSTAKNQTTRALDKRPVGPVKTTSLPDATVTNGTKPRATIATTKRPAADAANGARPKTTTATNRLVTSTAPKTITSSTTRPAGPATSKTSRPAAGLLASRTASTLSKPATATTKLSTTASAKVASSRAPSAGRTTAAQPNKNAAPKKDVSRPPSAAPTKKPFTATASPVAKKKETSKLTTVKLNSVSKAPVATKEVDPKVSQAKVQQPAKSTPAKKPPGAARFPLPNRPPLGRTPPASPASKPASTTKPATPATKRGTKPTQTISPFTKKTSNLTLPAADPQSTDASVDAAGSVQVADTVAEPPVALEESATAVEEVPTHVLAQLERDVEPEGVTQHREPSPPPSQSPIRTTLPPTSPFREQSENSAVSLSMQEQLSSPAKPSSPTVAFSADLPQETGYLSTNQTPTAPAAHSTEANTVPQIAPPGNLNEEEDEEEREGSQLVSVSEMSGTTQPTEESRPGSGGQVGGAAWKAGGVLLSELDSEEVSGSQQGASELSAPGVLEGTESTDDLGDGSLKGAIDMEGASAGSPDFEKVPEIPVNDFEDEDEDDSDRVCDMDVGSERTDEPRRPRHDNDVDEDEDDDVEMASEGVTESGLESYGNADEDDFAEDERLDNLNRVLQPPPPPPVLPSAPAAQWDQPNPFAYPWAEPTQSQIPQVPEDAAARALADPLPADAETPNQNPEQTWLEVESAPSALERRDVLHHSSFPNEPQNVEPKGPTPVSATGISLSNTVSGAMSMPEDQADQDQVGKLQCHAFEASVNFSQPDRDCQDPDVHTEREDEEEAEPETLPADEVLGGPSTAPTSNPSSSSVTEDEASDTEGEAQLEDSSECPAVCNLTFNMQPSPQRCLSTVEEGEEAESGAGDEATPLSATSLASYIFDSVTTASNSNAQSTGESCIKSPGIFSLEELPEEAKEPRPNQEPHTQQCPAEQPYIECGKQVAEAAEHVAAEWSGSKEALEKPEEITDDIQPPYYSAICEKTEDSFAGFAAMPHPHRRDHSSYPRTFCDIVKPVTVDTASPKLSCADLPPRSLVQQALSPQLRRLEQHQRQLLELQQRREQQSRPLEEAEQERKRRLEEEQRKKKEEAEEEIKRNKADRKRAEVEEIKKNEEMKVKEDEELKQRRDLELQLRQQQQELKQRQQIMQWQQEVQQSNKGQTTLLSPSSGLCTIYEALESSDEEAEGEEILEQNPNTDQMHPRLDAHEQMCYSGERVNSSEGKHLDSSLPHRPPLPGSTQSSRHCSQDGGSSLCPSKSPERPPPLDLDWGKKVDLVQQLINQTLLRNGDGCSSLLLLPGGAGGTLSPLESSLWPSLLPPLTPPSATVTSVSSFSPEATDSSPQGEWTVVELETHH
ncbi:protein piccolo [Girardinichthys multiradiatus]|uniref:protein piccolo n=1 Tax=Girardinichthys multiradiatus TaxID=208333 RepID=UPI001FAD2918|nr:protein piccolo [Girardinichthys multiradiatus]